MCCETMYVNMDDIEMFNDAFILIYLSADD